MTMKPTSEKYRVVFLIDCRLSITDREFYSEKIPLIVRQAALKLLTYFSSRKLSAVDWGFKFFNSCSLEGFARRTELKPFNVETFEEFENSVDSVLESERVRGTGIQKTKSPTKKQKSTNFVLDNQANHAEFDTLETLTQALTELIYDFQWTSPDISSPVSSRKRPNLAKQMQKLESSKNHFTFLVTQLPHRIDQFKDYFEIYKDQPSGKTVFDAMFTKLLYEKFYKENGIRLFWLDVHQSLVASQSILEKDLTGVNTMNEALHHLQGGVIPVNAILQLNSHCSPISTQIPQGSDNATPCLPILPLTSIVDFYLHSNASVVELCSLRNGYLLDTDRNHKFWLQLMPLVNVNSASSLQESHNEHGYEIKLRQDQEFCKHQSPSKTSQNSPSKAPRNHLSCPLELSKGEDNAGANVSFCYRIIGTMSYSDVPYECFLSSNVYMCSSVVKEIGDSSASFYPSLLLRLVQEKLVLILEYTGGGRSGMCLLQPVTPVCGSLTCLKSSSTYLIEKTLLVPKATPEMREELEGFVEKSVNRLLNSLTGRTHGTLGSGKLQQHCTATSLPDVNGLLEPWCLQSQVTTCSKALSSEQESPLLCQLQDAYKKEHQFPAQRETKPSKEQTAVAANKTKPLDNPVHDKLTKKFQNRRSSAMVERSKTRHLRKASSPSKPGPTAEKKTERRALVSTMNTVVFYPDFSDEDGLLAYIKESYDSAVNSGSDPLLQAQSMVSLVLHFARTKSVDNSEGYCQSLLQGCIQQTSVSLRKKYSVMTADDDLLTKKVREYELQVLLHMEITSIMKEGETTTSEEQLAEEIAKLVIAAFLGNPESLQRFMEDTLVDNYIDTNPSLLKEIYLEIGQDPPRRLAPEDLLSPLSLQALSVQQPGSMKSVNSNRSTSSNPTSNRPRRFVRHSSVLEVGSQRQVVMPLIKPVKPDLKVDAKRGKEKDKKTVGVVEDKRVTRSARKHPTGDGQSESKLEMKKVRRNLFTGEKLEKRQSDSAIQIATSRRHERHSTSDIRGKVLKTKSVAETPAHKQVAHVALRKLEKQRQRSHTASELTSVGESPRKPGEKSTPLVPLIKQKSFYSMGTQSLSRNMEKYQKLSARMSQPFASPTKIVVQTPKRRAAVKSILFSQLLPSPQTGKSSDSQQHAGKSTSSQKNSSKSEENEAGPANETQFPVGSETPKRKGLHVKKLLLDSPQCSSSKASQLESVVLQTPEKASDTTSATEVQRSRQSTPRSCSSVYKIAPSVTHTPQKSSPIFGERFSGKKLRIGIESDGLPPQESAIELPKQSTPGRKRKLSARNDPCPSCSKAKDGSPSGAHFHRHNVSIEKENIIQTRMCSFTPQSDTKSEVEKNHDFTPPTAKKRKVTKTPDSFDSWHRRKHQRVSSPRRRKDSSLAASDTPQKQIIVRPSKAEKNDQVISVPSSEKQGNTLHNTRSHEKRTSAKEKCEEEAIKFPFYEKQGFDLWNSKSAEKLQKKLLSDEQSGSSSTTGAKKQLNYFSSENEEVFLSGEEQEWESVPQQSMKPTVLRLKRRMSSKKVSKQSQDSSSQESDCGSTSKKLINMRSSEKPKFSPLSTGSLHHLLKSPMMLGDSGEKKASSSHTKKGADKHSKSRRSLYQST